MATLTESIDSREHVTGNKPSVTMHYILEGTADDLAARNLLLANTPLMYDGLTRDECSLEPVFVDTTTGRGSWKCTVRYISPDFADPQVGASSFSFDTSGGTQHITQSLSTIGRYPETAPNFEGAIGVTHESVEGVDITVPVYSFSETHYFADISMAYRSTLFNLTGKVNSDSFKGMAPGDCLFLGASGTQRGTDKWEISFRFAGSPTRNNIVIGNITLPHKKGWEYLWVRYADSTDEQSHSLVKKPIAVYVEKVYESANFALLGIDT